MMVSSSLSCHERGQMMHLGSVEEFASLNDGVRRMRTWTMGNRRRQGAELVNPPSVFSLVSYSSRVFHLVLPGNPSREVSGVRWTHLCKSLPWLMLRGSQCIDALHHFVSLLFLFTLFFLIFFYSGLHLISKVSVFKSLL